MFGQGDKFYKFMVIVSFIAFKQITILQKKSVYFFAMFFFQN